MPHAEIPSSIWLPSASHYGNLLESNGNTYAIFGAGALAVHSVMIRPTIDIDFVVDDYDKAIELLGQQSGLSSSSLKKERDGIQVADFYFENQITVQIWDNNLYSLPMTNDSWSRLVSKPIPGYDSIWCISIEDLIISKVGRHFQQKIDSQYEADKNAKDIIATIQTISKPDFSYILKRLTEGARREGSTNSSVHPLDWYFVREVKVYRNIARNFDYEKIEKFISKVLLESKLISAEYYLLHSLRKVKDVNQFKSNFMLNEQSFSKLIERWSSFLQIQNDVADISAGDIQNYLKSLPNEEISDYANNLIFSGKSK